ncbi:ATP-binding protein [Bradyrhizobium sp. 15]|uniref:sensor histidine kinase n=1 Tax=Bradyrhizobium sp. 15 TaxID=2782633 RepID=UPI001FFAAA27|nr:two-component sensor histidine kinase [Bradyrhizobium sp. 15]
MLLPEFARTPTFRYILFIFGAFAVCVILIAGFVYWQTSSYVTSTVDEIIVDRANAFAALPADRRLEAISGQMANDPLRVKLIGLFDAQGRQVAGNIDVLPRGVRADEPRELVIVRHDTRGAEAQVARAVARWIEDGQILVVGRALDQVTQLGRTMDRVLIWGLIPALAVGLVVGAFLSIRARQRVQQLNALVQRIVLGDLNQRLPTEGGKSPFNELAILINGMLDEIETLLRSVAGVGDDIAHDLRTPLTRVRVTLERARQNATTVDQLRTAIDPAIAGLDQSLAMITALLRIAEIEHGRRLAGFGEVALPELVSEVGDLYEPIAEDKRVTLTVDAGGAGHVRGDRDLLFEAIANLVDNAIKFTPEGGRVDLQLCRVGDDDAVRVSDTGPGIAAAERDLVARRFFRSDKSRTKPGLGLGLSLVEAIMKLHGFRFTISAGPGCVAEIGFPRTPS